jgi:hypothetical protein
MLRPPVDRSGRSDGTRSGACYIGGVGLALTERDGDSLAAYSIHPTDRILVDTMNRVRSRVLDDGHAPLVPGHGLRMIVFGTTYGPACPTVYVLGRWIVR